jgi:hypothetical protein
VPFSLWDPRRAAPAPPGRHPRPGEKLTWVQAAAGKTKSNGCWLVYLSDLTHRAARHAKLAQAAPATSLAPGRAGGGVCGAALRPNRICALDRVLPRAERGLVVAGLSVTGGRGEFPLSTRWTLARLRKHERNSAGRPHGQARSP